MIAVDTTSCSAKESFLYVVVPISAGSRNEEAQDIIEEDGHEDVYEQEVAHDAIIPTCAVSL